MWSIRAFILGRPSTEHEPEKGGKCSAFLRLVPAPADYIGGVKKPPTPTVQRRRARLGGAAPSSARLWLGDLSLVLCFVLLLGYLVPATAQTPPVPQAAQAPQAAQLSAATPLPAAVVAQALALARQAAGVTAPARARLVAEAGTLDPRLSLAPCAQIQAHLLAGVPAWGRTRVGLRCNDGAVRWNVSLPVTVQVWAPAVVLLADLPTGTRLSPQHLGQADVDWAAAPGAPFEQTDVVQGRALLRPLAGGQALRASDLQLRQWFARGAMVQVLAAGAGFAISAEGEALGPGLEGQAVRVRMAAGAGAGAGNGTNGSGAADTSRTVTGKVVGDHRVEVRL
jgi:flagellar basal body P-ring formation protein FlgA